MFKIGQTLKTSERYVKKAIKMSFLSKLDLKFDPCFFGNVYGTKDNNQTTKNIKTRNMNIRKFA